MLQISEELKFTAKFLFYGMSSHGKGKWRHFYNFHIFKDIDNEKIHFIPTDKVFHGNPNWDVNSFLSDVKEHQFEMGENRTADLFKGCEYRLINTKKRIEEQTIINDNTQNHPYKTQSFKNRCGIAYRKELKLLNKLVADIELTIQTQKQKPDLPVYVAPSTPRVSKWKNKS